LDLIATPMSPVLGLGAMLPVVISYHAAAYGAEH